LRRWGWLGRGLRSWGGWFDAGSHLPPPDISPKDVGVFVLRKFDGLVQGLTEKGEGGGGFGFDVAAGDGGKHAAQGGTEITGAQIVAVKERRNVLSGLLGGEGFSFPLGMEVAEMRMAGAARSAALAAIGKSESTQTGTVFVIRGRKTANFMRDRRAVVFLGGRRTANGAVRGHGSLLK